MVCLAIKRKEEVSYKGPKSLSFRENSRSFCVWFLKHKTPLENPPLGDREKLPQKSSLDTLRRSSVHEYLEDHKGSIIGVFFCSWAVHKLPTIAATQQLFWSLLFTPFQSFFIVINSLCLLLTNSLIAAKVEHNFGDSKAINRIFLHVHAGKHFLLNLLFICLFTWWWR